MQNQVVSSHHSHVETEGWGSARVPKREPPAWGGASSQRIEANNPTTMPA